MQTHSQSLSCSRIYIRRRPMYSLKILGVLLTEQPRAVFWSVTKSPRNRRKHFRGQHTAGGKQSPSDWFHARRRAKCRSINNNNNNKTTQNIFVCNLFCCSCHLQTVGEEISKETIIDIEFDRMTLQISTALRWKRREWRILESLQSFILASLSTFWFDFDVDQKIALTIDSSPKNNKTFQ